MKQKKLLKKIWKLLKKTHRNTERYEVSGDDTLPKELIKLAEPPLLLKKLTEQHPMPTLTGKTVKFRRPPPLQKVTVEATTGQVGEQTVDFPHPHTGEGLVKSVTDGLVYQESPAVTQDKGPAYASEYEPDHHPV